jgi:hypothetical protein
MNVSLTGHQLLAMTQQQLDELYSLSSAGSIPNGKARGIAIIAPGTPYSAGFAELTKIFSWQGKVFDGIHGTLVNRITPFGINAVAARVYKGASWLDERECIVLDYSRTSYIAKYVRDEIREIAPKLYLGIVFLYKWRLPIGFSLDFIDV